MVRAAREAGVHHFIFISFPPAPEDFALQRAKRAVGRELAESGLVYTVLQPTFFTELWLSPAVGFDVANASARIYGSGQNEISWISYLVCRRVRGQFRSPQLRHQTRWAGGARPVGGCADFRRGGGRKFTVSHVPEEALRAQRAAAANSLQEAFAALTLYYAPR